MSNENDAERTRDDRADESAHTGHDKYRPMNLGSDRSDAHGTRREEQSNTDRGEADSVGRNATGMRGQGTAETGRGARRYGRGHRQERRSNADDTHRYASDRHQSSRGGRSANDHRYGSQTRQRGRSTDSPHAGSQRGSHREDDLGGRIGGQYGGESRRGGDDQESLGNQYRQGGERGMTHRERRYGSRHGNSTRKDPRRE